MEVAQSLHGDPFVMGVELPAQGRSDLEKLFGPAFAGEALSFPPGVWSGPVESTYGWHLVWVEKRFDPRVPELSEVHSRVEKSLDAAKRDERVAEYIARMRAAYTIEVDDAAIHGARNG